LHREQRALRREIAALRETVGAMSAAPTAPGEFPSAVPAADASLAGERLALRGEVASLRRERGLVGAVNRSAMGAAAAASLPLPPPAWARLVGADGLPPGVLGAFRSQLGGAPFEAAHIKQAEGRFFYSAEAKPADGRPLELVLDDEGEGGSTQPRTALRGTDARIATGGCRRPLVIVRTRAESAKCSRIVALFTGSHRRIQTGRRFMGFLPMESCSVPR
jgi:hypothetical protein